MIRRWICDDEYCGQWVDDNDGMVEGEPCWFDACDGHMRCWIRETEAETLISGGPDDDQSH